MPSGALKFCCDSEELYLDIVNTYLEEDRYAVVSEYFAAGDIENYRIQVHTLKSGSRTIGANALSEEARQLEEAAKSGDIGYIRENTQRVLEQYRELTGRIRSVLDGAGEQESSGSSEGRILYIESDLMFRCLTERMLQDFGVMSAGGVREALKLIGERLPDLVLLSPAGSDALSVLRNLHADERLKNTPVVVYTADHSPEAEVMFLKAGAADVICKPADSGVLTERVRKLLNM